MNLFSDLNFLQRSQLKPQINVFSPLRNENIDSYDVNYNKTKRLNSNMAFTNHANGINMSTANR